MMPQKVVIRALVVRELTGEERSKIDRLVRAETAPVRLVRRAWVVSALGRGDDRATVPMIARDRGRREKTVRVWIRRFDVEGVAGLDDAPRVGRPRHRHPEAQREPGHRQGARRPTDPRGRTSPDLPLDARPAGG